LGRKEQSNKRNQTFIYKEQNTEQSRKELEAYVCDCLKEQSHRKKQSFSTWVEQKHK